MENGRDLATCFEECGVLRARARDDQQLTTWPSAQAMGIASQKAAALNVRALCLLAQWWCPQKDAPSAVPIGPLRTEA